MEKKPEFQINWFTYFFCNLSMIVTVIVIVLVSSLALVSLFIDLIPMNAFLMSVKFKFGTPEAIGMQFKSLVEMRLFFVIFSLIIDLISVVILYLFFCLRNLLRNISEGLPFSIKNALILNQISNIFIAGALCTPLFSGVLLYIAKFTQPAISYNLDLFPDLALLFSGFLIRILAKIFAYGSRLQRESDQTI